MYSQYQASITASKHFFSLLTADNGIGDETVSTYCNTVEENIDRMVKQLTAISVLMERKKEQYSVITKSKAFTDLLRRTHMFPSIKA